MALSAAWQEWLLVQKGHQPRGVARYGYIVTQFFRWLVAKERPVAVAQITREAIEAWQKYLFFEAGNLANTTRATKLAAVRSFLAWLVHAGHLAHDPSQGIPSPRSLEVLPQAFGEEELEMLFSGPDQTTLGGVRDYALLMLLYAAGPRASELVNLDVKHVKDHGKQIMVTFKNTKRGKDRIAMLAYTPSAALRAWLVYRSASLTGSKALFLNLQKPYGRLRYDGLNAMFHKYAERVGLKDEAVFLHKMRSTFATNLYNSGDDYCPRCKAPIHSIGVMEVQMAMGHNDPKTTIGYIAISPRQQKKLSIPEARFREIERRG